MRIKNLVALAVASMAFTVVGCGDDDGITTPTAETVTEEGWNHFEAGSLSDAIDAFNEALDLDPTFGEAFNGIGWARLNLLEFSEAIGAFDDAIAHGVSSGDPQAGKAIAYRELSPTDFQRVVESASATLEIDSSYVFSHDDSFNWRDLHLLMAQSHYALQEFTQANESVALAGGNLQDPDSPTFLEDLLLEIQRLGRVLAAQ